MAPHAGRSGAEALATVRSTCEEPRKSPSVCTAPSRAGGRGGSLKPLSSEAASAPAVSSSSRRGSLGGPRTGRPGSQDRARSAEAARADTAGAPVKARRPGSQRRKRARRGAPAHSPRRRPGGRPQPLPCPTPAGSVGYPPPAQPGPRPGPWPITSAPQPACSRRRRGSDLPLLPSPRIARRALALSRDLGGTGHETAGRRTDRGCVSVPRPGCRGSENAQSQRPARGTPLVPLSAAGQASTGRLSRTVFRGTAPPNGGLLGPNFLAVLTSPQLLPLRCLLELMNAFLLFSKKKKNRKYYATKLSS